MGRCEYCKNYPVRDMRLKHNFPTCIKTREKWTNFLGREPTTKAPVLCSDHFDVDCYQVCGLTVQLKPGAIPTEQCQIKHFPTVKNIILNKYKNYPSTQMQSSTLQESSKPAKAVLAERNDNINRTFPPDAVLPPTVTAGHDHPYGVSTESLVRKLKRRSDENLNFRRTNKNLKAIVGRREAKIVSLQHIIGVLEHSKSLCSKESDQHAFSRTDVADLFTTNAIVDEVK